MADIDDARAQQAYLLHNADELERAIRKAPGINLGDIRHDFLMYGSTMPVPQIVRGLQQLQSNTLVSKVLGKQQKDFANLPDKFLQYLAPYVNVYKTYTIEVSQGNYESFDILLKQGRVANQSNRARDNKADGVILRSVEFQRLGGNPEEVDTNIKFTLELFAKDVRSYFKRDDVNPESEIGKRLTDLTQITFSSEQARSAIKGTAWIDLIKIDPGQELNATVPPNSQMVTTNAECKIKVELGYSEVDDTQRTYTEFSKAEWDQWKETIAAQKETFYLSLLGHKFDFKGFQGVGLKVDFVASANANQLSPLANLIGNPANQVQIEQLLDKKRKAIAAKKYYVRERKDAEGNRLNSINDCIDEVLESIDKIDKDINEIQKRLKLGLLNQIYLWGSYDGTGPRGKKTRVYTYFGQPNAPEAYGGTGARRGTGGILTGDAEGYDDPRRLQEIDFDIAMGEENFDFRITEDFIDANPTADGQSVPVAKFVFLGDIIEAAYEILVPSGNPTQVTHSTWTKASWSYRIKKADHDWSFEPRFDEDTPLEKTNKYRYLRALEEFGGVGMGRCIYDSPVDLSDRKDISMMNIPIQLDLFRNWYLETYVSSNVRIVPLRDFITSLMKWVSNEIFRSIPYELGSGQVPDDTPQFIVNNVLVDQIVYEKMYSRRALSRAYSEHGNFNKLYFSLNPGYTKREDQVLPMTFIDQVDRGVGASLIQNGNPRLGNSIPHIIFGASTKGIVKKITFQREDIPGHAEARLFSDRQSVAGNIALREKYNVDFETIGTTAFLPGSILYLDPIPLDLGFEADSAQNPNYAKSLGMGGVYRVVNLTSRLSFDGQGNSWDTKLVTKWETFGNGQTGNNTRPPYEDPELEKCIQDKIAEYQRKSSEDDYLDRADLW